MMEGREEETVNINNARTDSKEEIDNKNGKATKASEEMLLQSGEKIEKCMLVKNTWNR